MKDCKYRSMANCAGRPDSGLVVVAHCLVCWLARDRADAAAKLEQQKYEATIFRARLGAKLERLRNECRVAGRSEG